ncbi:uncharacterized protein LOC110268880 isoform X2 [Arachis ipaensis]|uniref:uncharacterized protein LOC110268880 isoform X2 n=1 Tax=Arachis ipaensis TaxID=130454 RepID=UPI000A2B460C|nr:uncharacterized protein LOC110268880 isoform X2 [Arachis ipaensis]XP_025633124.1 uncharacterized protein LOC112727544 isoform X3 [Arachis hypogaea]
MLPQSAPGRGSHRRALLPRSRRVLSPRVLSPPCLASVTANPLALLPGPVAITVAGKKGEKRTEREGEEEFSSLLYAQLSKSLKMSKLHWIYGWVFLLLVALRMETVIYLTVSVPNHSTFLAGYLYYDLCPRLVANGRLIEVQMCEAGAGIADGAAVFSNFLGLRHRGLLLNALGCSFLVRMTFLICLIILPLIFGLNFSL